MASNLLITNLLITHITCPLLILTVQVIAVHWSRTIDRGREEDPPPSETRRGGASATRSSGPQPSLSPTTPKLAPRPWDPVWVLTTNAVTLLLLLPPALRGEGMEMATSTMADWAVEVMQRLHAYLLKQRRCCVWIVPCRIRQEVAEVPGGSVN